MNRELDKKIANLIFDETYDNIEEMPYYSSDMSSAWLLVDKLQGVWDISSHSTTWNVRLSIRKGTSDKFISEIATTASEAMCLAALRTVVYE